MIQNNFKILKFPNIFQTLKSIFHILLFIKIIGLLQDKRNSLEFFKISSFAFRLKNFYNLFIFLS
jgi:hypothetical protein